MFDYFLGFDPVGFRPWLVVLMALVAVAIPAVVAIGRPAQRALVRFGHLAATVIVAAGVFVLFAALGTDTRSAYFTEVLWLFTLKPAWGGWAILLLTAVILVCAIGIAFDRKTARAAAAL